MLQPFKMSPEVHEAWMAAPKEELVALRDFFVAVLRDDSRPSIYQSFAGFTSSPQSAYAHLETLEAKGLLERPTEPYPPEVALHTGAPMAGQYRFTRLGMAVLKRKAVVDYHISQGLLLGEEIFAEVLAEAYYEALTYSDRPVPEILQSGKLSIREWALENDSGLSPRAARLQTLISLLPYPVDIDTDQLDDELCGLSVQMRYEVYSVADLYYMMMVRAGKPVWQYTTVYRDLVRRGLIESTREKVQFTSMGEKALRAMQNQNVWRHIGAAFTSMHPHQEALEKAAHSIHASTKSAEEMYASAWRIFADITEA